MKNKKITLVSLASAIAAIAPSAHASTPTSTAPETTPSPDKNSKTQRHPNAFYNLGEDLMGVVTSTAADGTLVADHYSHSSHSSHSSHYSSR